METTNDFIGGFCATITKNGSDGAVSEGFLKTAQDFFDYCNEIIKDAEKHDPQYRVKLASDILKAVNATPAQFREISKIAAGEIQPILPGATMPQPGLFDGIGKPEAPQLFGTPPPQGFQGDMSVYNAGEPGLEDFQKQVTERMGLHNKMTPEGTGAYPLGNATTNLIPNHPGLSGAISGAIPGGLIGLLLGMLFKNGPLGMMLGAAIGGGGGALYNSNSLDSILPKAFQHGNMMERGPDYEANQRYKSEVAPLGEKVMGAKDPMQAKQLMDQFNEADTQYNKDVPGWNKGLGNMSTGQMWGQAAKKGLSDAGAAVAAPFKGIGHAITGGLTSFLGKAPKPL